MKKQTLILAAALLLSACNSVEAPAANSLPSSQSAPQESVSLAVKKDDASQQSTPPQQPENTRDDSLAVHAPMPGPMPLQAPDALELPTQLAASAQGWAVELLTPAQYQMQAPTDFGGPRGFVDCDVFHGVRDGKVTLFNANGKQISEDGQYAYDEQLSWSARNGGAPVKNDGMEGLVDAADGKTLIPTEYDMVNSVKGRDYYTADKDRTTFVLRKNDLSLLYTLERGDVLMPMGNDRDVLYQNGTLKLFTLDGRPVKNLACDDVRVVAHNTDDIGVNRLAIKEGEKWAIYDGDGERITNAAYERLGQAFRGDYIEFQKSGKWGVMDYSGQVTIKPRWDDIILSPHGASLYQGNKCTATTELDREPDGALMYDAIGPYSESGYAWFERGGKYGLLDDAGNVVMTPRQNGPILAGVPGFDDDVFLVAGDNGSSSYGVLADGQMALPTESLLFPQGIHSYHAQDEIYNLICTPSGKWGYVDARGQYVIDSRFGMADAFIDGRDVAIVSLNGKICLIDRKGNTVLETVFDDCGGFNPDTMVAAMRYTDSSGRSASCLVRLVPPAL